MREKLIELRKKKKLTQEMISSEIGVARSTYNAYELGTITPPLDIAIKIKEILKYKNDDIFLQKTVSKTDNELQKE